MERFDWRDSQDVTPVQDQKSCGDCWAFAAIAAFESSYLIENGIKSSAITSPSASEQQALDCSFAATAAAEDGMTKCFDYFVNGGEATRRDYPYTAIKAQCQMSAAKKYTAIQWDYVQGANIPPDSNLKTAICMHGPIVAAVDSTGWDKQGPNGFSYSYKSSSWNQDYPDGAPSSLAI